MVQQVSAGNYKAFVDCGRIPLDRRSRKLDVTLGWVAKMALLLDFLSSAG
jgi:hypothetical protein